jgi:hypothetical protein
VKDLIFTSGITDGMTDISRSEYSSNLSFTISRKTHLRNTQAIFQAPNPQILGEDRFAEQHGQIYIRFAKYLKIGK